MGIVPRVFGMEVAGLQGLMRSLVQSRTPALLVSEKGVGGFEFRALSRGNKQEEGVSCEASRHGLLREGGV